MLMWAFLRQSRSASRVILPHHPCRPTIFAEIVVVVCYGTRLVPVGRIKAFSQAVLWRVMIAAESSPLPRAPFIHITEQRKVHTSVNPHHHQRHPGTSQQTHNPSMAPLTTASDEKTHQALLDKLDIHAISKPFRNPHWKPPQRRNKNLKQIIGEASRKEASVMATQNNSGISTPALPHSEGITGNATPLGNVGRPPNIAQAAQSLSTLVLEKNGRAAAGGNGTGPAATYTNIESAPSFHPSSQKKYCDITGLPAPYTDPKTRLRYHNKELYGTIRTMPQNVSEAYLAARGAHTVLK